MNTLENWNLRRFERYVEGFEAGLHDVDCEQRERSSLCHCSKRRREAAGKTELPTISFPPPVCNGCGQDVEFDDSFSCPRCKVYWGSHATDGDQAEQFTDDHGTNFGSDQFGERLIVLASERGNR